MRQESFSRLWDGFETDDAAKAARDKRYRELIAAGHKVKRSSLPGQVRKYVALGVPDGRSCTVYYLTIY